MFIVYDLPKHIVFTYTFSMNHSIYVLADTSHISSEAYENGHGEGGWGGRLYLFNAVTESLSLCQKERHKIKDHVKFLSREDYFILKSHTLALNLKAKPCLSLTCDREVNILYGWPLSHHTVSSPRNEPCSIKNKSVKYRRIR